MTDRKAPRLKDVAALAGVSVSAASRILRGDRGRFGDSTCQRVLEASTKLGWRPNLLVSGMQTGRTQTVGVMIPPYDSFWVNVLSGIHRHLAEADYLPITVWIGDLDHMPQFEASELEGLQQINRLLDRRVDGLIMWPDFAVAYQHRFQELIERRVPVVVIDHYVNKPFADSVETNEEAATQKVADHLYSLGHRRIACISSRETSSQTWALARRSGFEKALSERPGAQFRAWRLDETGRNGREVAQQLLTDPFRPTAVFAVTDHEAALVYHAASALGLTIPGDVSVVGFSDLDFAQTLEPPLTTIRQRPREVGVRAASLIMERLEGELTSEEPITARIDADLVVRASTGPVRATL